MPFGFFMPISGDHASNELPGGAPPMGVQLPADPATKPGTVWPPLGHVDNSLPTAPVRPGNELPNAPVRPSNELPAPPPGKFWVVAGIPGYGWRYVCIDTSLKPDHSLPGTGARPDQGLPSHGRPDNSLPSAPVRPGNELPNAPVRPGNELPNAPVRPGNELPGTPETKPTPTPPATAGQLPGQTPQPRR